MHCHLFAVIVFCPLHRMWYWCVLSGIWTCQSLCLRTCLCSSGSSLTCSLGWTVLVFATQTSMMLWNRSSKTRNTWYCLTRCLIWIVDLILWVTSCSAQQQLLSLVSACECLVVVDTLHYILYVGCGSRWIKWCRCMRQWWPDTLLWLLAQRVEGNRLWSARYVKLRPSQCHHHIT